MITSKQALKIWSKIVDVLDDKGIIPVHIIIRGQHEGDQIVMEFDPFNDMAISVKQPQVVDVDPIVKLKKKT